MLDIQNVCFPTVMYFTPKMLKISGKQKSKTDFLYQEWELSVYPLNCQAKFDFFFLVKRGTLFRPDLAFVSDKLNNVRSSPIFCFPASWVRWLSVLCFYVWIYSKMSSMSCACCIACLVELVRNSRFHWKRYIGKRKTFYHSLLQSCGGVSCDSKS